MYIIDHVPARISDLLGVEFCKNHTHTQYNMHNIISSCNRSMPFLALHLNAIAGDLRCAQRDNQHSICSGSDFAQAHTDIGHVRYGYRLCVGTSARCARFDFAQCTIYFDSGCQQTGRKQDMRTSHIVIVIEILYVFAWCIPKMNDGVCILFRLQQLPGFDAVRTRLFCVGCQCQVASIDFAGQKDFRHIKSV